MLLSFLTPGLRALLSPSLTSPDYTLCDLLCLPHDVVAAWERAESAQEDQVLVLLRPGVLEMLLRLSLAVALSASTTPGMSSMRRRRLRGA